MDAIGLATDEEVWQAAEWYRALSLTERLVPAEAARTTIPAPHAALAERALGRFHSWKTQKPFEQESLFAERLALDSVSERQLLSLLAEPAESLRARVPTAADWSVALRDAFADTRSAEKLLPLLKEVEGDHPLAGSLTALGPLFERALRSVEEVVQSLRQEYGFVPIDTELLPRAFMTNIAPTVLFQVSKAVILELHVARLQGRLEGETSEARFQHFMRQLSEEGRIVALLLKYPVLARQLVLTIDQWAESLCEFFTHLRTDWDVIYSTFFTADDNPGRLVDIDAGIGDKHRRGRSVLLLRFESGVQLLYKPKPLAVDVHFQELVSWLNDRGAEPRLRTLKLVDRGGYGWSEFVAASSCTSGDEVARFYERQGGYLALLYALDATDLHNENLIAAGEHPMLVDLEALFHPHVHGRDPMLARNLAAGALDQSVWQVGLLPRRVWSDDESLGVDMSGLGGQAGQMNPHPLLSWNGTGSDEMRLGRRRVELPVCANRPRLAEQDVEVLDYADAILAGFTRMYRLLCRNRSELLTEQLPRFSHDEIRVVVRSTNVYGLLLYESFHPDLLRDALERDRFFDRLWVEAAQRPYLPRVISAERRDLLRGDIPVFSTFPDSRTLFTSEAEPVGEFFDVPSMDLVRQRIERLGEEDLVKQTWIIEASLATLLMDREDSLGRPIRPAPIGRPVQEKQLLTLANGVGKRLDELALQNETGAYWLGVGPLDESTWALFPSGIDLYAGTSGMALFLAYLGAITGEPSHTQLANRALMSVRNQVWAWLDPGGQGPRANDSLPTVGAFEGLASVMYVLTNLGVLWGEPDLLDEAEELVETLPALVSKDDHLDIIYGSAGCILSLLSLYAARRSPRTLEVAISCGERLLATAQPMPEGIAWTTLQGEPPLGGFSHGTAGLAYSLMELAARSGQERFRHSAVGALAYDRSLFVTELNNWADLREFPATRRDADQVNGPASESTRKSMVAWCHGAAGIGLGRLGALHQLDDAETRREIDIALTATIEHGFAMNHSLCHGALGNVELLLMAARTLNRPEDHDELERAIAVIVGSIEANGAVTGVPLGVETPGFMTGLAGIGYELLRLAEPDKVPSALLLAPPCWEGEG